MPIREFAQRAVLVLFLAGVALFLWNIRSIVLIAFGTILAALLLDTVTEFFCRHVRLARGWCLFGSTTLILLVLAGFVVLFGAQLAKEAESLAQALPGTVWRIQEWLAGREWGRTLLDQLQAAGFVGNGREVASFVVGTIGGMLGGAAHLLIVIFGAIYLAARPQVYIGGTLDLLPPPRRARAARVAGSVAVALRRWLLGQVLAMGLVAVLTTAGLALLGVPSALALGLIAGVAEFVPIIGPILAALPAMMVALPEGPELALYVALLYLAIQQVESYLITPLVQQAVVHIPPVIVLFAILGFGTVFGALGLLFATPLAIAIMVGVKALYIDDLSLRAPQQRAG